MAGPFVVLMTIIFSYQATQVYVYYIIFSAMNLRVINKENTSNHLGHWL